ncbi:hypothetical protein MTR67_034364 [Solanum verrucosum]|uniref:Integrase catalytic domain-containing protein n=1 Tax=Solanum verrucosum TaxID=315347 RepID=A0AAF0U8F7_SOLVR|nr:hypothetical protein MTR67_034364 [Solanum verrucosum]
MVGGHSGIENTYKKLTALVYWKGLRDDVHAYVKACDVCQKNKYDNASINMDFIDGLPRYKQKIVIWVVVDRLTKYAHFVCLAHPYSAHDVVSLFLEHIYKLHGVLEDIVNDRDLVFTSKVWQELFAMLRATLNTSTTYHLQTDGQTEVVNRCLETYLRCFCSDSQKDWSTYLAITEWWYNTIFRSSIQQTLYEALYGQPPPLHLP